MKIGKNIIEEGIKETNNTKERVTVRGIIRKENLVYMLYSNVYDDYTFPGGGIKEDEDKIETLKRELNEELGVLKSNINDYVGYTVEYRYGINGSNSVYKQTSHYYNCEILEIGETNYIGRENHQGLEGRWIEIDEAIKHNYYITKNDRNGPEDKGYKTVLVRENQVLNYIKGNIK